MIGSPPAPPEDMHIIYFKCMCATIVDSFVIVFFVRRSDDLWENKRNKFTVKKYAGRLHNSRCRSLANINGGFWLLIIPVQSTDQTHVER